MNYLDWHYFEIFPKLLVLWRNLALFPFYYFSVPLHLTTLFAPWKRQRIEKRVGFDFGNIITVISFNIISRCIGAIIRLNTIFWGLLLMLVLSIIGFVPVFIWTVIPGLTMLLYFARKPKKEEEAEYFAERANKDLGRLAVMLFKHKHGKFVASRLGFEWKKLLENFKNQKDRAEFPQPQKKLKGYLRLSDLFKILAESYPPFVRLLEKSNLKSEDVYKTAIWYEILDHHMTPLLLDLRRIKNLPGIGSSWAYGYTVEFDKYASDITKTIPSFPLLVGREDELKELERILIKTQGNNALIVGKPGVARHMLVETLAYRVLSGNCPNALSHKRILKVNMHSLTSAKASSLEVKGLIETLLEEAGRAGNIIIFIDEIDKYLSTNSGRVDLSDVFTKFAESPIGIIGITTPYAYHKYIETDSELSPLFEKIDLLPPTLDTVFYELTISIVPVLEKKYNIIITFQAIKKTIEDASRFISSTPYPSKAIDILDGSVVYLLAKKSGRVLFDYHIDEFLSEKFHFKVGELQQQEKEKLANLESLLHARVINQEEAISAISSALRRARLNISSTKRPIGSFLFLGPTGVGKTETAKALTEVYFGTKDNMLRFDMSQYQKEEGLERLIGSIKLGTAGELTSRLADNPFSLILFDEFEKADKSIFNLFLTLLDEGYITDSRGRKINAKNNIIIATSNAGAEFIRESINNGISNHELEKALIDYVQKEKIFAPELLNRFDSVVVFTPLSEGQLREIAKLMLADLNKRLKTQQDVSVLITKDLIERLAFHGFDQQFGARAMKRTIAEKIEDQVAKRLLGGKVKKGEEIRIEL